MTTALDILLAAEDRLALPEWWCPDGPGKWGGPRCLQMAINDAADALGAKFSPPHDLAYDIVTDVVQASSNNRHMGPFNDDPATTYDDVMTVLSCAIDVATWEASE